MLLLLDSLVICTAAVATAADADEDAANRATRADAPPEGLVETGIGITSGGQLVRSWIGPDDLQFEQSQRTRLLLLGEGQASQALVKAAVQWLRTERQAEGWRQRFAVSAVRHPFDDLTSGFPPAGDAYRDEQHPERDYLWRWVGVHAPDLVLVVRSGERTEWALPSSPPAPLEAIAESLRAAGATVQQSADESLSSALSATAAAEVGIIPAFQVSVADEENLPHAKKWLPTLLRAMASVEPWQSPARRALQKRLARSPQVVAEQLAQHYGRELPQLHYIPSLAVIGRLRLPKESRKESQLVDEVVGWADDIAAREPRNGSEIAGHLLLCELARRTVGPSRQRLVDRVRSVADLAFDEGQPRESMPFHLEMSDSVFMSGPLLAEAGALTGEARYFDACLRHVRFLQRLDLRPDGLYRHWPGEEAAWGRGNGFPALGLALSLSRLPPNHPAHAALRASLRDHLRVLAKHQTVDGCWRQVIDKPGSYRELTATCMITLAMQRAVRQGWVEQAEFGPRIRSAWRAVRLRIAPDGRLIDVCTGTGKQPNLQEYYRRQAILGRDPRGGAMALMLATELLQ